MVLNLNIFFKNILFIFIVIYLSQGAFYPSGALLGKLSLFVILFISLIYFFKCLALNHKNPIFFYSWISLFFLNFIGFIIGAHYDGTHYSQIRNISTAILPFYPFYYFSTKGNLSSNNLVWFFYILVPVCIMNYYASLNNLIEEFGVENIVNNSAYLFVALIPYVFLIGKRKILAMLTLLILLFFIIQSSKRGALIAGVFSTLIFIYHFITTIDPKKKLSSFSLIFLGTLFLSWYSYDLYLSNEYLMSRFDNISENSSNRNVIYTNIWNHWYNSDNIINVMLGYGFVTTILYSGTGHLAHNDWLELLNNFGILGVTIYVIVILSIFRNIFYKNTLKTSKLILLSIVIIWLLKTFFSMHYTNSSTIILSIILGYVIGLNNRNTTDLNKV